MPDVPKPEKAGSSHVPHSPPCLQRNRAKDTNKLPSCYANWERAKPEFYSKNDVYNLAYPLQLDSDALLGLSNFPLSAFWHTRRASSRKSPEFFASRQRILNSLPGPAHQPHSPMDWACPTPSVFYRFQHRPPSHIPK